VKIFANDTAVASVKDRAPLDSGSVLAMEVYKAQLDSGRESGQGRGWPVRPGEIAVVVVMESRAGWGEGYSEEWRHGTWEFVALKLADHSLIERDYQPCFACQKPLDKSDFVFSSTR
jgi:hypothetical protein